MSHANKTNEKELLLVVDDQANNLKFITDELGSDYRLSNAGSGFTALKILEKVKPDLILLDIMMPGMDGYEVCRRIKSNPEWKDIPILFLSAKNEIEDVVKGLELGAVDYIVKPFNIKELRSRIETHLSLARARATIMRQKMAVDNYNERLLKTELQLTAANESLARTNKEKDKFFSIIAHDLKSPFNAVNGFAQLLFEQVREKDYEGIEQYAELVMDSSNKAVDLLQTLMDWVFSQTGRMVFQPKDIELGSLINDVTPNLKHAANQKSIKLHSKIPEEIKAHADKAMLSTVIRNLISNAIKFTPPGGKIILSAKQNSDRITFSVADTGVGMSEQTLSNLFQLDKVHSTDGTNKEKGTGLGLILCKEFVVNHGGDIWAESQVNKGTTFYFTLPLSQ